MSAIGTVTPLEAALEALTPQFFAAETADRIIAAKCAGLMAGYHARWQNAPYRIEAVERVVSADLHNPETGRTSRTFTISGKLDVIATETATGRSVIFDHKTTSEDIADVNSPYWRQLAIEGQVTHYMLLEWLNGRKADFAVWDVVRKPGIAPKLLSKKERESVFYSKNYFGYRLSEDDLAELAASERETPRMYAARLTDDCSSDRPERYFQRRQIPRLDAEVLEYAKELWEHSQDIILARRNNRHPRNSGACMLYKSPCKYLGICSGYDSPDSEKWQRAGWVHPELPILAGDGKDILTNSRIRCFQTCRRKHQLQYELGIERIDEEEREALVFGNSWHLAQEAYFLELKHQQERNN